MAVKHMIMTGSASGIKSIPLHSFPPATWTSLTGGASGDDEDVNALYEKIPWLYRGVNAICNALADMPHRLHRGGEDGPEVDDTALPFEIDLGDLLDNWARMMTLNGAGYAMLERNQSRMLKVRPLHPSTMTPQYSKETGLTGFKRRLNGQEITLTLDEIAYVWQPNHKTEVGPGIPPAQAAACAAGLIAAMDEYGEELFEHGALSPTLIETHEDTDLDELKRIEDWFKRAIFGIKNAFTVKAVAGAFKSQTLTPPLKDLVVPELTNSRREDIATALGVPQTLLFSNAANYATAAQDDLHFYDKTVLPLDKRIVDALNKQIFIPMGLYLQTHHEEMEIYQRQEMAKAYGMAQLYTVGAIPVEWLWDVMSMPEEYRNGGTYYQQAAAGGGQRNVEKAPTDTSAPQDQIENPQNDIMKRWRKMALNRLKEGKPEKMVTFEDDDLAPVAAAAVRGALAEAKTAQRVNAIFDNAAQWGSYP